jgi:hypothetical protein
VSIADEFVEVVARIRSWGFEVVEWSGCYGRSNGGSWSAGRPVGHVNHHYVCSMNPDQSYIDGLVQNLANGTVVQWFADVNGVAYLIGVGPMNHAGTGNQSVLDLTRADRPPPSNPAGAAGSISGNSHYAGVELQHPGDSTPYPAPMLDAMVAINAAEFLQWGYSANRAIMHSEWSSRKVDLSAGGGVDSDGWSAAELRRRVAARMTGGSPVPQPPDDGDDMITQLYVMGNDGAVYVTDDLVTRRHVKSGDRLNDALWNATNVVTPDGPVVRCYMLSGGKWQPFTSYTGQAGKMDKQSTLDQFGTLVT